MLMWSLVPDVCIDVLLEALEAEYTIKGDPIAVNFSLEVGDITQLPASPTLRPCS